MKDKPIWRLMNLFCRAHPWHGVEIGEKSPEEIHCYIEIVPTDTVKFELEKNTGLLIADRPQKYSNHCPTMYGLIPQTYAGKRIGDYCCQKTGRTGIHGDQDPLDICVLTEKPVLRGDILVTAIPIGGIRAIDENEADDKIIAVLKEDLVYERFKDIHDCPQNLLDRLKHYFLTYKESPEDLTEQKHRRMEITDIYGKEEAQEIIRLGSQDYDELYPDMRSHLHHIFHESPIS
ncbi:MAG: Inorganic pyrophosphatase [Chlamydiae bacterium]|nr:Inorganic pyrophosphatase [Chlamydiota bacterium]